MQTATYRESENEASRLRWNLSQWGWGCGRQKDRQHRTIEAQFSQRWLKRACATAGVPRFSPNGLRRAATDAYARAGVDPAVAAAQSGHSIQVMMKHYRQVTTDDQRTAVERASLGVIPEGKIIVLGENGG